MNRAFVGEWQSEEGDSFARIVISENASGELVVEAYDSSDGEVIEVSNLVIERNSIEYCTRVPSNNYRSRQRLTVMQDGSLRLELTLIERWIRCE